MTNEMTIVFVYVRVNCVYATDVVLVLPIDSWRRLIDCSHVSHSMNIWNDGTKVFWIDCVCSIVCYVWTIYCQPSAIGAADDLWNCHENVSF